MIGHFLIPLAIIIGLLILFPDNSIIISILPGGKIFNWLDTGEIGAVLFIPISVGIIVSVFLIIYYATIARLIRKFFPKIF
jgi:hypothetical protein